MRRFKWTAILFVLILIMSACAKAPSEIECKECGERVAVDSRFCSKCGAEITTNTDPTDVLNTEANNTSSTSNEETECSHTWIDATCSSPKKCQLCGVIEGAPLDHSWQDATCVAPSKCRLCGIEKGTPLGHDWGNPTCTTPRSCLICWTVDNNSKALGHSYVHGECEICGDQSDEYFADYDKYIMAAHLYQAVIDCAKFPSSVQIERAYYIDDLGQGYPAVRLECAAANSMGGNGILYGVVIQYPAEGYEDDPYADQIYVYDDTYCFECNVYDNCPVLNYNGYEKLDISRIISVHDEDINFN